MITLFTAPKPFTGHIGLIQENALRSWRALSPAVQIIILGDEQGMTAMAASLGIDHEANILRNAQGTPMLDSIFQIAEEKARFDLMTYANADILLLDDFLPSLRNVEAQFTQFLLVGQRWDLQVEQPIDFTSGWQDRLRQSIEVRGRRHKPAGSDYFVFRKGAFGRLPPFALGRAGWDNWMIYEGRRLRMPVVDASEAITVIHQDHDYAHLPGAKPHYRLPESAENVAVGGGNAHMFTLRDANWRLQGSELQRRSRSEGGLRRWLETSILTKSGNARFGLWVGRFFHPLIFLRSTIRGGMRRLARRVKKILRGGTALDASG